ncbi:unnamed protein product [Trichobilharzia regenti]|nr:unnamed protein product [Trichobilharzia regenti]
MAHLQAQIRIQAAAYRANVIKFIEMLLNHTDPSLRLLAEHMNFNGHYCNSAPGSSCATGSVTSGYPIPVAVEGGAGDGEGGYQQKAKSLPSSSIPPSSLQQPHEHQQQEVKNNAIRHSNVIILRSAMPYSGSVTSTSSLTVASRHQETPSCTSQASDITSSRKTSTGSSDDYKGGTVLIK